MQVAEGFHKPCVSFLGNDQSRLAVCGRKQPWVSRICLPLSLSRLPSPHTGPCVERASEEVGRQLHAVAGLATEGRQISTM